MTHVMGYVEKTLSVVPIRKEPLPLGIGHA
jgi:hypothetical protein